MARARNIKPGFFTNEVLGELDPLARILFAGLWCHADREGRLEDRLKRLKPQILPFDNCDIEHLAQCLHDAKLILRYVVDGKRYIQILTFKDHQNPHIKECASTIPAPDLNGVNTGQAGLIPSSLIPDSPIPSTPLAPSAKKPRSTPVVKISFDIGEGKFDGITDLEMVRWGKAYPAIDVSRETLAAAEWLISNPKNLKSNYRKFLVAWFARSQDKARPVASAYRVPKQPDECQYVDRQGNDICGMRPAKPDPLYAMKPICEHHRDKLARPALSLEKIAEHLAATKKMIGVRS